MNECIAALVGVMGAAAFVVWTALVYVRGYYVGANATAAEFRKQLQEQSK